MTDVDFYAETALTGGFLGLNSASDPDEVQRVLGAAPVDDLQKKRRRLDFGLVEFYFDRDAGAWTGQGIGIQVHRMAWHPPVSLVPAALWDAYGEFTIHVSAEEVFEAVRRRVPDSVWESKTEKALVNHYLVGTGAHLISLSESDSDSQLAAGEIWSLSPGPAQSA